MFENFIVKVVLWVSFGLSAALFLTFLIVQFVDAFQKLL